MVAQVVLVEDDELDAQIERITLAGAGLEVIHTPSLLEGETQIMAALDPACEYRPMVVLMDLWVPATSHPELQGSVLAAALVRRMQLGLIRPTMIVALTNYLDPEHEEEALYAGCHAVLGKPLTQAHAVWLRDHILQYRPTLPRIVDTGRRLYQKKAEEILDLVRRGQLRQAWTPDHARLLLSTLTAYPPPPTNDSGQQATLLLTLGGRQAAAAVLNRCATMLDSPYADVLVAYLQGKSRRTVRDELMRRGYSRAHSYHCIKGLPERISAWLQHNPPAATSFAR